MAKITYGGSDYDFVGLNGPPLPSFAPMLEDVTPPAVDGLEVRSLGQRAGAAQYTSTVDVDDSDAAEALESTYRGLKKQLVTFVDQHGQSHGTVLVMDVQVQRSRAITRMVGGVSTSGGYVVTAVWSLARKSVS
jgi:hypothetical protein